MAKKAKPAVAARTAAPATSKLRVKSKPTPKKLTPKKSQPEKQGSKAQGSKAQGSKAQGRAQRPKQPDAVKLAAAGKAAPKAYGKAAALLAKVLEHSDAVDARVLDRLAATVLSRRAADPLLSHSARLMSRGTAKVAQKFGEEAVECLIEAVAGDNDALVAESADVLYHLIVLWVNAGVAPDAVWQELHRREGMSGIDEKARRKIVLPTTKLP